MGRTITDIIKMFWSNDNDNTKDSTQVVLEQMGLKPSSYINELEGLFDHKKLSYDSLQNKLKKESKKKQEILKPVVKKETKQPGKTRQIEPEENVK
ncbi:MAG: hypothetical protein HFJ37_00105 [Clostridia bacterium]|nr:hypothetical protein [Clostridia bacterium]